MTTPYLRLFTFVLLAQLFGSAHARAQDVRELTVPVADITLTSALVSTISAQASAGYRVIDLEWVGTNGAGAALFDAELVQNIGPYASGWWWYYGMTGTQLSAQIAANQGRLIDIEPYETASGLRFACVMVPNTGANAKVWWYYYNSSVQGISNAATANNARIVDVQPYVQNGTTYYAAIMIHNTGADYRPWWWYVNVGQSQLNILLGANNARLYDIEPRSNGNFDCVMIRQTPSPHWYWWYGMTATGLQDRLENYGIRAVDVESYLIGGVRRYAMIAVSNGNAIETEVGNGMRSVTNGTVGFSLKEVNGPVFAWLNHLKPFEPASTMKTLHHVHAMYQVRLGNTSLTTPVNVFTGYSPVNNSCPIDINPVIEPLSVVLTKMMENSDNARTQAVTAFFGQGNINNTASNIGMQSTSLNHRLGCGPAALANPNQTTLWDLTDLHEVVAGGYLGPYLPSFYAMMLNDLSDLNLDAVMQQEGASIGLPSATIQSFISNCQLAHKGGSYDFVPSAGTPTYHRAEFGRISLPWLSSGALTPRQFAFGAFVNDASSAAGADNAIWTKGIPVMLRDLIHDAMATWSGNLASTTVIGSGCGTPNYSHVTHTLPRLGVNVAYRGNSGLPNAIALLAFGFSDTNWNGLPLPLSLQPFGSSPGCFAYNDWAVTFGYTTNTAGFSQHVLNIPNDFGLIGYQFYSQWYSLNGTTSVSSNGLKTQIGL